jgi:hypothetical protein
VTDTSGAALFDVAPLAFDEALRRAVADDSATVATRLAARRCGRRQSPSTSAADGR